MNFDFPKLESLRLLARKFLDEQRSSLDYFAKGAGFGHTDGSKVSVSSTATCVLSLTATNLWRADEPATKDLLEELIPLTSSSKLPPDNPFTTAWILEAVTALKQYAVPDMSTEVERKVEVLRQKIRDGKGGVEIAPYPPSGYLTQLTVRVLIKRGALDEDLRLLVKKWAWSELARQMVLIQAESKSQDVFAVAYLLILVTMLTPKSDITPEETSIRRAALATFFRCQLKDGSWPTSRPIFHYPAIGNAHCYEYELLTQLLSEPDLTQLLLEHLPAIERSVQAAASTGYNLGAHVIAWSSGHHPQVAKPESWATASVYHFFYKLDRLLAKAVQLELFRHVELPPPAPGIALADQSKFASKVLDSRIYYHNREQSLKQVLWDTFVHPISLASEGIERGIPFDASTPRAAIFFGPPGTSKTELSKEVAKFLGWPFLSIDPSMLLRKGMNEIQAEANVVFRILEQTEGVVVLLDEFDELVQDRELDRSEQPSRLLTTAMLPKLASIHKRGTLVLILATNNIDRFDLAIRRQGRFDRVLQILPPTYDEKLSKKTWGARQNVDIGGIFQKISYDPDEASRTRLADLTFGECNSFADELAAATTNFAADKALRDAAEHCTMSTQARGTETWKLRCEEEKSLIR